VSDGAQRTRRGARSWRSARIAGLLLLWAAGVVAWWPVLGPGTLWSALPAAAAALLAGGRIGAGALFAGLLGWLPVGPLLAGVPLSALRPRELDDADTSLADGLDALAIPARGPIDGDPWPLAAALLAIGVVLVAAALPLRRGDRAATTLAVLVLALPLVAAVALAQVGDAAWPGAAVLAGAVLCATRGPLTALAPAVVVLAAATVGLAHAVAPAEPWLPFSLAARDEPFTRLDTSQSYGPLTDRRTGATMLEIDAPAGPALWRMQTLDSLDLRGWATRRSGFGGPFDGEPELPQPAATLETTTVTVRGLRNRLAVAPGRIVELDDGHGGGVVEAGEARQLGVPAEHGRRYRVTSEVVRATAADLAGVPIPRGEQYAPWTRIRSGGRPRRNPLPAIEAYGDLGEMYRRSPWGRVLALARDLASGADAQLDVVRRVRSYLVDSGRFRYTTDVPEPGWTPLIDFLLDTRAGYCQQFAGAAALLLRMIGVPTRVATGFATGAVDGESGYLVRDRDAHAWVEVYFPGTGWVPFDMTPPGDATTAAVDPLEAAAVGGGDADLPAALPWALGGLAAAGAAVGLARRRRGRPARDGGREAGDLLALLATGGTEPGATLRDLRGPLARIGPAVAALAVDVERERFAPEATPDRRGPRRRVWRALRQDVGTARATAWLVRHGAARRPPDDR